MALKFPVLASSKIKSSGVIYTIYYIPSLGLLYDLVSFCYAFLVDKTTLAGQKPPWVLRHFTMSIFICRHGS